VWAKICGGVYALRGFVAAVVLAWTLGLLCGALPAGEYTKLVAEVLVVGVFMVVIGIGFSLYCQTATRAMALTIVGWLAAAFGTAVLAGILTLMVMMAVVLFWWFWTVSQGGMTAVLVGPGPGPPLGAWGWAVYHGTRLLLYALAALLVAGYCRLHFDRLAGRSSASPQRGGPSNPVAPGGASADRRRRAVMAP